jgi:tRNA(Ile)-lysidine synthase
MTAHTQDDQAETVMLQLIRSTELLAFSGIARRRDRILRPLLDVPRSEIAAYAAAHRLAWREDPTNLEPRYLRNRIRKELLPLIERRYRSRFSSRLAEMARMRSDSPRVVSLEEVKSAPTEDTSAPAISMMCIPWSGGPMPDGVRQAAFDAEALLCPSIRKFRPGDKIRPFGMKGRTKVAELLRTAGLPPEVRTQALLVVDEADRVVWVPGVVRSADAPVQSETKRVWIFELRDNRLEAGGEGPGKTRETERRKDS